MSFSYEVESPTGHMYNYSENGEVLFSRATAKCCTFFFKDVGCAGSFRKGEEATRGVEFLELAVSLSS